MFNYYLYEKQQKDKEKQQREQITSNQRKTKHKSNLYTYIYNNYPSSVRNETLVKNYNNRINLFILNMVKNPLIIKEHVCPIESTRKQFMEENSQNIKGSKKFSFKKYLTEKERLKQYYAQRKHLIEMYEDKGKMNDAKKIPEKKRRRTRTVIYQQPRMRFKPRTEFERIVDTINDYNYGKVNNDLIKKQLKNMELALMKKKLLKEKRNELSDSQSDSDNSSYDNANVKGNKHETSTERTSLNQSKQSFYKSKGSSRILVDNSVAKKLMEEYHYKTHFKAAAQLADKYSDDIVKQKRDELYKTKSCLVNNVNNSKHNRRTHSCIKLRNKTFYKDVASKDMSKQMSDSVLTQFASKFPLREENFDLVQANPLLYNLNFHSFKSSSDLSNQQQSSEYSMEEKLNYLKNLSFNYSVNEEEIVSKKKVTFAENIDKKKEKAAKKLHSLISTEDDDNMHIDFNKDDKIWVNDEAISLGQMDLIALKILRNCNYFHKKNNNNNTSLKKGDGKLMITSGMSVNEFTKKYKFN